MCDNSILNPPRYICDECLAELKDRALNYNPRRKMNKVAWERFIKRFLMTPQGTYDDECSFEEALSLELRFNCRRKI
jgi:hypothetical protein